MRQVFRFGAPVTTADGRRAGELHRVVMDQQTFEVTAIAVRRGLIESGNLLKPGGWSRPRDQRVPIDDVAGSDDQESRLRLSEDEFLALPGYVMAEVPETGAGFTPPRGFEVEDAGMRVSAALGGIYEPATQEIDNRAAGDRHLSGDAAVWRRDPHSNLGDVDRILVDGSNHVATALVVSHGALFAHDTVVPTAYVVDLLDDLVHVDISEQQWASMARYETEQ